MIIKIKRILPYIVIGLTLVSFLISGNFLFLILGGMLTALLFMIFYNIKKNIARTIFIVSFIPYVLLLIVGTICYFTGFGIISSVYGFKAFITSIGLFGYFMIIIPIIPICLVCEITYLIKYSKCKKTNI